MICKEFNITEDPYAYGVQKEDGSLDFVTSHSFYIAKKADGSPNILGIDGTRLLEDTSKEDKKINPSTTSEDSLQSSDEDVTDDKIMGLSFKTGLPVDHIVKVIKWLFIEQDITYWNTSGRSMLMNHLLEQDLALVKIQDY